MKAKIVAAALVVITTGGCSSQSAMLTNDSGQSGKCENWGFGIIGAPVAMASQSDCIKKAKEAGYQESGKPASTGGTVKPSPAAGQLNLAFPEGWQTKSLPDAQRNRGIVLWAGNVTADSQVMVSAADLRGITDRSAYMLSRRAATESRLKDASHSEIVDLTVNGLSAKQFQVTGVSPEGPRLTYLSTFIFGQSEVVAVVAWTTAPNFDNQHAALQTLTERVSGIQ